MYKDVFADFAIVILRLISVSLFLVSVTICTKYTTFSSCSMGFPSIEMSIFGVYFDPVVTIVFVFIATGPPREFRGTGALRPPTNEASRNFVWSRTLLWKIIAGLPYETPHTLKHLVL